MVARCIALAGTPVTKQPTELFRTDGKRPDGITLVPWQSGKSMLGRDGHMPSGRIIRHWVRPRGRCCSGTRRFSQRGKYASIGSEYLFAPIAVETLGPINTSACQLFANLEERSPWRQAGDDRGAFLFQRVSVVVQRYNAVLLHDTLPATDCTD